LYLTYIVSNIAPLTVFEIFDTKDIFHWEQRRITSQMAPKNSTHLLERHDLQW